jgi:hypothetical protein
MPQTVGRLWFSLPALGIVFASATASAQTSRYHHGLYVRVAGGGSYFSDVVESDPLPLVGTVEGTLAGGAVSTLLAVGGSISPGFVLGGAVFVNHMPSPSATNAGSRGGVFSGPIAEIDFEPSTLTVIGPYADYYFNPASGLHVQGALGYGILSLGQGNERGSGIRRVEDQTGSGFAAVVGGGYEWWVSNSWGVGILGQLMFGLGSGQDSADNTWKHRILIPGLLVSATMN